MDYLWSPWRMQYIQQHHQSEGCVFCLVQQDEDGPQNLIIQRGGHNFVILNRFPYNSGHVMVVPKQHSSGLGELDSATRAEMMELTNHAVQVLQGVYRPHGFNVGLNLGEAAGAGIAAHLHMHIVPRWNADSNFMSTLGMTRVLPEALPDTYARILGAW